MLPRNLDSKVDVFEQRHYDLQEDLLPEVDLERFLVVSEDFEEQLECPFLDFGSALHDEVREVGKDRVP